RIAGEGFTRYELRGFVGQTRWRSPFLDRDGSRCGAVNLHVADETKPSPVQRANQALVVAAVAECAACRADAGAERRVRDDAALPDRVDQLVPADDPIAVSNEVHEQVEHLRLDVNHHTGLSQLLPRDIDLEILEAEAQGDAPRC